MKPEDLNKISEQNNNKYNEFVKTNPEFKDEKYTQTLEEAFSK